MTIGEIAKELNISTYSIHFYEKEGLLRIPRNDRGIRDFDEEAITSLKAILHYRNVGMRLEDIKTVFKNFENHELSVQLLKETKTELDQKIAELESTRDYLIYKIGLHERIAREEKKKT